MNRVSEVRLKSSNKKFIISIFIFSVIFILSTIFTKFNPVVAFTSQGEFWRFIFIDFLPPNFSKPEQILNASLQTFYMAFGSTVVAAFFALIFAFMGTYSICNNKILNKIIRGIASVLRNIPAIIWAFVLVAAFGIGNTVGVLALIISTTGFLIRAFIETLDELAQESIEALRATGASTFAVITQSAIPTSLPGFISWFLYCIETNIRASTILGMVGAGGIGLLMTGYIKQYNYHYASAVIITIIVIIIAVNLLTEYLRKILMK